MTDQQQPIPAPIIIKRIKKGGHGHHGGAWKVAYADFVTAMMAFFLLLWLLNTTTPEQRSGIADYFTPTIGIKDSQGIGFDGGKKPNEEGTANTNLTAPGLVAGQVRHGEVSETPDDTKPNPDAEATASSQTEEDKQDSEQFKITEQEIKQTIEQDPEIKDYKKNILLQETPEGLKIDMIDDPDKPMFVPGGAVLTDIGKKVLDSMSNIVIKAPNNISINGHTDAASSLANPQYTNWELSADRANAARRFLSTTQLEPDRIQKVVGLADRELLTPGEPTSPRNRRVTIIIMRGSYFRDPKATPTTRTILSVPDPQKKEEEVPVPEAPQEPEKPSGMFDPSGGTTAPAR